MWYNSYLYLCMNRILLGERVSKNVHFLSLSLTHIHTLLFTISQTFATNEGKWLEFETETEHFNFWLMYIWWLHVCVCVCIYLFMFSSWGESANPLYSMFSFNVFNIRLGKCASIVYVCVCGINDTTCVLFIWLWKKWNQLSQQTESRLAMTAVAISKMNDYSLYIWSILAYSLHPLFC